MNRSRQDLRQLKHPYYIVNFLFCLLYHVTKLFGPLCSIMYDSCEAGLQEYELLIFMASFITLRSKRHFSLTDYVAHFCLFAKVVNLILFWRQNAVYAILYGMLWLLQVCFLHQPTYEGPNKVLYLRDVTFEQEVLNGDTRCTWIVEFYTAWSPACIKLQPIFAELSEEYGSQFVKFAKLDIIRYPQLAAKYNINTSSFSNQLPTLIMFRQGRELTRRPALLGIPPKKVTTHKFIFLWENIVNAFSLNELHAECKQLRSGKKADAVDQDTKKDN